jgi:large subunit ribosomal protein L17
MHRHSYQGKKFGRAAAPRRAMMRNLLDSLILYERIETTEVKAKELARVFDRMVTKAKKQDIHNLRQIKEQTINPIAAEKLFTDLVKGFAGRNSGYARVIKTGSRLGDGANMAVVELVLDEDYQKASTGAKEEAAKPKQKPAEKAGQKTKAAKPKAKKAAAGASK